MRIMALGRSVNTAYTIIMVVVGTLAIIGTLLALDEPLPAAHDQDEGDVGEGAAAVEAWVMVHEGVER